MKAEAKQAPPFFLTLLYSLFVPKDGDAWGFAYSSSGSLRKAQ